ncbi:hypothetical protein CC1G_07913 [Coprinopsis cinerea okayama7|uniref:Uncharacterized protein n=1 Tax=Coprinopsis cinerea (strain Okayama-7 / 130 / ATCC MYA-4618 / FGSC 9003) TaxID=240176 RepID=A8P6P5_COPC7|nr:hypothetical protein CC1G_07913 [Coprinopsis cinerea okayama7\|eukprot:XP_001839198.1 hypothetical protein CC1G_07913 [Coprinopsis cinerea okayama7\
MKISRTTPLAVLGSSLLGAHLSNASNVTIHCDDADIQYLPEEKWEITTHPASEQPSGSSHCVLASSLHEDATVVVTFTGSSLYYIPSPGHHDNLFLKTQLDSGPETRIHVPPPNPSLSPVLLAHDLSPEQPHTVVLRSEPPGHLSIHELMYTTLHPTRLAPRAPQTTDSLPDQTAPIPPPSQSPTQGPQPKPKDEVKSANGSLAAQIAVPVVIFVCLALMAGFWFARKPGRCCCRDTTTTSSPDNDPEKASPQQDVEGMRTEGVVPDEKGKGKAPERPSSYARSEGSLHPSSTSPRLSLVDGGQTQKKRISKDPDASFYRRSRDEPTIIVKSLSSAPGSSIQLPAAVAEDGTLVPLPPLSNQPHNSYPATHAKA